MVQQGLNGPDVRAAFQEMRGETMAESVRADPFGHAQGAGRFLDSLVHDARIHVVPSDLATPWVPG